jgi:tetratricopeptide (TPR) repeat protein
MEDKMNRMSLNLRWTWLLVIVALTPVAAAIPEPAKAALLKGDWAQVISVLEKPGPAEPDVICRLAAAHACLAANRANEAFVLFLAAEGNDEAAWKSWTEVLEKDNSTNAIAAYLHGDALARCGNLQQAEERLDTALELNPMLGLALVARGALKACAGRTDDAYLDLVRATQVAPALADAHASLGCLEVILQNAEGAKDAFDEALQLDPSFALAYNGRGCARYGLGKPDEAHLDYEMAATLCPALEVAEVNKGQVLAMVAGKIDEKVPRAANPGTTIETRAQTLVVDVPGIWSQGLGSPEKWAPSLIGHGQPYERFNIRFEGAKGLAAEPGKTIVLPNDASPEVIRDHLQPVFDAVHTGKHVWAKVDMNIGFLRYMSPVSGPAELRKAGDVTNVMLGTARSVRPGILTIGNGHSAGTGALLLHTDARLLDALNLASCRLGTAEIARVKENNPNLRILLSSASGDYATGRGPGLFSIDKPGVVVANLPLTRSLAPPVEDLPTHLALNLLGPIGSTLADLNAAHSNTHDPRLLATRQVKVGTGSIQQFDGTLGDLAQSYLRTGSMPAVAAQKPSDLQTPLTHECFTSTQPWSQMPKFLDEIVSGRKATGPIAIVAQDPVKSYAFERMLLNRNVQTVVTPPLSNDQLQHLGSVVRPERIVGFDRKLDDNWRKIVPFPDDHGGGGGAVASGLPVKIDQNTFSFSGPGGRTVTLPLPSRFDAPREAWNSFKTWTPPPTVTGPGGVDTKQLEWVFVDKGQWPVMTIFTLGYEPPTIAVTNQKERK